MRETISTCSCQTNGISQYVSPLELDVAIQYTVDMPYTLSWPPPPPLTMSTCKAHTQHSTQTMKVRTRIDGQFVGLCIE